MDLTHLTDNVLLAETKKVVKTERAALNVVLYHLLEVDRRRLYATLKCTSLFDYAVKVLSYSADEAARRISAMRLLKALPQIEEKIESGALSLTHLNMAQTSFRQEDFTEEKKVEVLEKLENTSTREAAQVLAEYSSEPTPVIKERMRHLGKDAIEVKFGITDEVEQQIKILKGLLAHSHPNITLGELFAKLCEMGIQTLDPAKKSPAAPRVTTASVRRSVWKKANSKCENCGSCHALQIDHRTPKACGGSDAPENLRLLCRKCNQRAAIETLGLKKMDPYIHDDARARA